jgi:DNA-binding Lrp family transcriptional regulator
MTNPATKTDDVTARLLGRLQQGVPLVAEPYEALGRELGLATGQVMATIQILRESGVVRMLGPVMDARGLGYRTTLVAARVKPENLKNAAVLLTDNSHVSHAYERDHAFNLWFTLALPSEEAIETEIQKIGAAVSAGDIFQLPATKLYKIGAFFGDGAAPEGGPASSRPGQTSNTLSAADRAVLNAVQRDLPMTASPFAGMAAEAGLGVADFLAALRSLEERGFIRRYSAAVNHRRAGYTANGMACFAAADDVQDEIGGYLAARREVSHCYVRRTNPGWPYSLFAMIHGREKEVSLGLARQVAERWRIKHYDVLFSTREIKKQRIRYPV